MCPQIYWTCPFLLGDSCVRWRRPEARRFWCLKPPFLCLGKLMSHYLGDVIPFSQMARTSNLRSTAAGIAQNFKNCGWEKKQVGSDRWAEWLTSDTHRLCAPFSPESSMSIFPHQLEMKEEVLGRVRVTLWHLLPPPAVDTKYQPWGKLVLNVKLYKDIISPDTIFPPPCCFP